MTPAISIIIPIYNGEKYLKQCLDSIVRQTFTNFEVLLINDGSTDNSQSILDWYKEKDERFKIYQIPNSGVSHARNVGLSKATGEWITFVDCDDWVENNYLETLYGMTEPNADIVMANFYLNLNCGEPKIAKCSKSPIHKKDFQFFPLAMMVEDYASCDNLIISVEIICAACNKLTRRQLIDNNKILFKENLKLNEDGLFHLTCYLKAKDIIIIDTPLYHYRIDGSSSNRKYRQDVDEQMRIWKQAFECVAKDLPLEQQTTFRNLSAYRRYLNLINLLVNHKDKSTGILQKVKELNKYLENGIYDIDIIPHRLKYFKRIEMFLLKYRQALLLLLFSNIKNIIKK